MSEGRSRWRIARRAVLTTTAAVAVFAGSSAVGLLATPGVSLAATPTMSLGGAAASVTTSNGKTWMLIASWNQVVSGVTPTLTLGLDRIDTTGGTGYEGHFWYFDVKTSTLTFNSTSGKGTLNTGTETNPVAKVDLSFKSTSSKSGTCTSGSETIYSGTLSGDVSLVTGLTGGGTVGGTALKFTMGTPELTVDSACVPPLPNECAAALAFDSGNSPSTSPSAVGLSEKVSGKSIDFVGVERQTLLSSPKGAMRDDVADQYGAPAKYNSTTKVLSVSTSTSGLVTGSATLSGGTLKTATSTCTVGTKKYTLKAISDQAAKYQSPAGKLISAKTSLSGTLTAPASTTTGLFDVITIKAA